MGCVGGFWKGGAILDSGVVHDKHVVSVFVRTIICFDLPTGQQRWEIKLDEFLVNHNLITKTPVCLCF